MKIIKIISLAILLLTFTVKAEAQSAEFGLRYMPTISSLKVKTYSGATIKGEGTFGYGIGAILGFNFTKHVGVQGEIIYNSISQSYTEQDVKREINLKYINVPLLLSLNTGKGNQFNVNVVVGPQIGFNVGSSINTSGGDGTTTATAVLAVKKSDLGFAYGTGVDFGLNESQSLRFCVGFRGVIGLIDISEDNKEVQSTNSYYILDRSHLKTNSLYLGFSVVF